MRARLSAFAIGLIAAIALSSPAIAQYAGGGGGGGSGTVTTTGSPASGNLAKFSGATSITNGDISGDCTTSGTLAIVCTKTNGVALTSAATTSIGTSGALIPLLSTANTWSLAQTFTTAPVFTDQSGSRTALGLGTAATQNTGTSGANVPLLNGNNVYSGTVAITGTSAPTQGAGTLGLAGTATAPTLGANSEGDLFLTAAGGLNLIGQGSSNDFTLLNKSGTSVCTVATGTTTLNCTGLQVGGSAVSTATAANPTGTVGLSAVNGSAATFMRSDAAPPLSQAIAPTWTGAHIWTPANGTTAATYTLGTITSNTPAISITGTYNNSGTTFAPIFENITNTASASASSLINLQIAGATQFAVDLSGTVYVPQNASNIGRICSVSAGAYSTTTCLVFNTNSAIGMESNGNVGFNAGSYFAAGTNRTPFGWANLANLANTGVPTLDTAISRDAAGVMDVGNGAQGDKSGTVQAATFNAGTSIQVGSTPHLLCSATAPTISSGFGSSPSIVANNGTCSFQINVGTGGSASSGVIGLPTATTGWTCSVTDITTETTTVFMTKQTASSTTTATVGNFNTSAAAAAWTASDKLNVICTAY